MDLGSYLAKPDKTIAEHNEDLQRCLKVLINNGYLKDQDLIEIIREACKYHDYGKANKRFQERVKSEGKIKFDEEKEITHNVLSLYFIDKGKYEEKDYLKILFAVAHHHNYCNVVGTIKDKRELIKELLEGFETFKFTSKALKKANELAEEKDVILIKGVLNRCDYCASAGCEIEYKNDFLKENMDSLLKGWQEKNSKAKWNEMQEFCDKNSDKNIIVIGQTGLGKTEAGLKWIGNNKGFFVLPLRTAINAMYGRIRENIVKENVENRLAILHSESVNYVINQYRDIEDIIEYNNKGKRLSMPLTITTMDQLFDFVYKYNGYEMKLALYSYSKIVIDEIQMYGPDLLAYLIYGIKKIIEMGGKVAILTATLPPFIRSYLGEEFEYKEFINDNIKRHNLKVINSEISSEDIIEKFNENLESGNKANKILVICNTIKKAQSMYDEIVKRVDSKYVDVFHSKFTRADRSGKEREIIEDGKTDVQKDKIWVSTSIVEASLDIDFDYIYTELQDLNSLFQRLGRCNRKGVKSVEEANCFVYTKIDENLIKRGEFGFIDGKIFDLSLQAIKGVNGLLTESEKIKLLKENFTVENIAGSEFENKYREVYNGLKNLPVHESDKKEIKLREIDSIDVIPKVIYDENEEDIENILNELKKEKNSLRKIELVDKLYRYVVNIQKYNYRKCFNVKELEISEYRKINVIDCNYDKKVGFSIKTEDKESFVIW